MKELIKYLEHLPTCTMKQNWGEAIDAMLDTPTNLRDQEWTEAMEEMNMKMRTCSCGMEEAKSSLQSKGKTKEEVLPQFTFERLPDESCIITVKGINSNGETYFRQGVIDSYAVFSSLKSAMQSHANKDGWVSCAERFPDGESFILIWGRYTKDCPMGIVYGYFNKRRRKFYALDNTLTKNVTHWMPLPNPPQI